MNKKQAKEILDFIEDALLNTETKALKSVGSQGKYPYMVGSYESSLKYVSTLLSNYTTTLK